MVSNADAANWYVDKAANGSNNGNSWANAWTSLGGINWATVAPGDTVFISGGTSSKSYWPEGLSIDKSGTRSAPITIRVGQDAGHNGNVQMQGLSWGNHQWVTVDGSKGSPVPPTNVEQVETREFVNSIGIWIGNANGPGAYMGAPVGNQMLWCAITNTVRGTATSGHGLWANVSQPLRTTDNVIRYNLISHTEDDGIVWIGNLPAEGHGEIDVGFNIIEYVGDDGLEANHGFDVHDNVIGPCIQLHGHPDGIQSVGSYWKVYNNKFYDFLNAFLRMQAASPDHSDVLIFNNVFVSGVPQPEPYSRLTNTGIELMQYANGIGELPLMVWSNIVVANNTFYTTNSIQTGIALAWGKRSETTPNAFVHNVVLTNCLVANNLAYVSNPEVEVGASLGVGWQPWKTSAPWGSETTYSSEQDVVFDWNTASGTVSGVRRVGHYGVGYPTGEAMALSSIWKNNKSTAPVFVQEGANFELAGSDTSALNLGTNLSSIFNFDILNRPRNVGGAWDRGAYESGQSTAALPGVFNLSGPAPGATGQSLTPQFVWAGSSSATSYTVELSTSSGFPQPLLHASSTSGPSYQMPAGVLSPNVFYYWRVRASNSEGSRIAANAPFSFSTASAQGNPPGAFSLTSPASNAGGVSLSPTLLWSNASGEDSYVIEIDNDAAFALPLFYQASVPANTTTHAVPTGVLAASSQYYWRIQAINTDGQTLADYSPRGFSTTTSPGTGSNGSNTNGLLVWLKFDDEFSDSVFEDSSGNGNHGYRFGRIGSVFPANSPTRVLAGAAAGTIIRTNLSAGDYAGDFMWQLSDYGIYNNEGAYVGITNGMSQLTNMPTATIMTWGRYEPAPPEYNYSVDGNAHLLSAGTSSGVPGTWDFGRYNKSIWLNNTRFYFITNQVTFAKTVIEFPDRGFDNNGDTTNWNHYAITWNHGVVIGYLNGRAFVTNDSSAIVSTLKVGRNPNVASPWIGIGCNTHAGTPWLDDEAPDIEYPNHGWMNGSIDDVRIYDRVLSAAELQSIVSGVGVIGPTKPSVTSGVRFSPQ